MNKQPLKVIKLSDHPNTLGNYARLYFSLVFVAALLMIIFIPVAIGLGIWGMITDIFMDLLCIALFALSGIFLAYLIMFNIIAPIRAFVTSKKLSQDESTITIYENCISFCSVYTLDGKVIKDEKSYEFDCYKKIKDKKDRFLFVSKKEYGNFAFYIWKDTLDEKSLNLIQSKVTK